MISYVDEFFRPLVLSAADDSPRCSLLTHVPISHADRQEAASTRFPRVYYRSVPRLRRAHLHSERCDRRPHPRHLDRSGYRSAVELTLSPLPQLSRSAAIGVSANTSRPVSMPIPTANAIIAAATAIAGPNAGTNA